MNYQEVVAAAEVGKAYVELALQLESYDSLVVVFGLDSHNILALHEVYSHLCNIPLQLRHDQYHSPDLVVFVDKSQLPCLDVALEVVSAGNCFGDGNYLHLRLMVVDSLGAVDYSRLKEAVQLDRGGSLAGVELLVDAFESNLYNLVADSSQETHFDLFHSNHSRDAFEGSRFHQRKGQF